MHRLILLTFLSLHYSNVTFAHDGPAYNENGCHLDIQCYHCDEAMSDLASGGMRPSKRFTNKNGDLDCGDFKSQSIAQEFFETNYPTLDPHRLDLVRGKGDFIACESRPRPVSKILAKARIEGWASKPEKDKICSQSYAEEEGETK